MATATGGTGGGGAAEPIPGGNDNPTFDSSTLLAGAPAEDMCVEGERCYADANPDEDNCGTVTLNAKVETIQHPGNVLLVFDTSGSMAMDWNGKTRWEQAGPAIINALMPMQDLVTVGTIFFPRSDPNAPLTCVDPTGIACIFVPQLMVAGGTCGVTPITSTDQINFMPGPQFLTTFAGPMGGAPLYAPVPGGFTPLKEGLMQAQAALSSSTLEGITSVVIITDGDPNCEWDQAVSQQIVDGWLAMGIKTYVVGLPGTTGAGDAILVDLAQRGGTMQYIVPTDSAMLEAKLREIASETVKMGFDSCSIELDPAAEVPEKLLMIVEENGMRQNVPHEAGPDTGWTISDDGLKVEITGQLCNDAMGGRFNSIVFEFGCPDVPPPPTLPPVL